MVEPVHRDMMADFYRLFEQFETLADVNDTERWEAVGDSCRELHAKYHDLILLHILYGFLNGLEELARQEREKKEAASA